MVNLNAHMPVASPFIGSNLELRAFEPDDITALHDYLNHPVLAGRRYIPWDAWNEIPLSRKRTEDIYHEWAEDNRRAHFALVHRQTLKLVGHAELDWGWDPLSPSVSIVVAPSEQRKGHGSEVLRLLLAYLFEHTRAHNVSGWMADWNQPARAFALRHGFQEAGAMRRTGFRLGKFFDTIAADLLRPEWEASRRSSTRAA